MLPRPVESPPYRRGTQRQPALVARLTFALFALFACAATVAGAQGAHALPHHAGPKAAARAASTPPPVAPRSIALLTGLYASETPGWDVLVFERDGRPWLKVRSGDQGPEVFPAALRGDTLAWEAVAPPGPEVRAQPDRGFFTIERDSQRRATTLLLRGQHRLARQALGPEAGSQLVHLPVRPLDELRREALAASPPVETNRSAAPDLAELVRRDRTIHLEIRYATTYNLFGTVFYSQARAFLQRPAAESLARASTWLKPYGVGLLVHDGYRPWYVTKMFWDAATPDVRPFVADPSSGSKHNRGAAVDLSLYDLRTGTPVEMPSTYDETTIRAAADWPGGTSRQRWYRDLLRQAMESHGFTVNPVEWWHFDFEGWDRYPILNTPFEALGSPPRSARPHTSTSPVPCR